MKVVGGLASVVLWGLLAAGCGGSPGSFFSGPVWVETDVKVTDIDGDGRPDVLRLAMSGDSGQRDGHLVVYRQTASGAFAPPMDTTVGRYPWRMAVAALDGDAWPDVVVVDADADVVWLLLQDATVPGRFGAPQALFDGAADDVVIADLNHDGAPDVAVARYSTSTLRIRYQDPIVRGRFGAAIDLPLPGRASQLASADIDGDGREDLVAWVVLSVHPLPLSGGLVALIQQPDGGLAPSGLLAPQTGLNGYRAAIADATGDGRADLLAFLSPSSTDYKARLVVVPQTSAGGWGTPAVTSLDGVQGIDDAVFIDLSGNGAADAAVAGFWPESGGPLSAPDVRARTNVLLGSGSGGFVLTTLIEMPVAVSRIAAGDLDGDGRNDLVGCGDAQCFAMYQSATPGSFLPPRALR
jgi:hypothetical protein